MNPPVSRSTTQAPGARPWTATVIAVLVALIVLWLTLGSLRAAGMPLLTALLGVGLTIALIFGATGFATVSSTTPLLALMLGLAVGIDYALFILSRFRTELRHTSDREHAIGLAVGRAGSAVVFAGLTVIIALVALAVVNIPFLTAMGLAAAATVLAAVLVALTLLPAVLGFVGTNIDRLSIPGIGRNAHGSREGFWFRWSRFLQTHPWPFAVLGLTACSGAPAAGLRHTCLTGSA